MEEYQGQAAEYVWKVQYAKRKSANERASGGMLMRVRRKLAEESEGEVEEVIEGRVKMGKVKWRR